MIKLGTAPLWVPGYFKSRATRWFGKQSAKRVWVSINDHYEPLGGGVSLQQAEERVARWTDRWPVIADSVPRDASGLRPKYSFFYPQEEYRPSLLEPLAEMTRYGVGDVEVHIHHDQESAEGFREKITTFKKQLRETHGLLHDVNGQVGFAFIHGNWALDNSLPGGSWCGLTGEILLLKELGCYADLTMPALPSPAQGGIVNSIYWCKGSADTPRSYDSGTPATVGGGVQGDLLMITGPLGVRYRDRLLPRLEMGEVAVYDPPTPYRIRRWLDLAPRIGDDIFIKLYAHGAREDNAGALLGDRSRTGSLEQMYRWLHQICCERGLEVHWSSAYEMYCAAMQLMQPPVTPTQGSVPAEDVSHAE
ncbi:MAG: hypothetical protein KGK08_13310 [Acidobacteriota bacterium]|nr:hypothetical protein [Acidobacteriota bacterium]